MRAESPAARERVIAARHGMAAIDVSELWRFRELFLFLAWRDILVRYKQTYLGIAWAVLQPVLTILVFTVIFGRFAKFDTQGAPYDVMAFAALLPWQIFSNALGESSLSLVAASRIISKVYFPRLIVPSSAVLSGIVDALIGTLLLFGLMIYRGVPFTAHLLLLPFFMALAFVTALSAGIWFSALNVRYRDVKYVVPFITRIGIYVTPVAFDWHTLVPQQWRFWFSMNPMVGIVDGFRWCVLGEKFQPYWPGFWISTAVVVAAFILGLFYFRAAERTFADVV